MTEYQFQQFYSQFQQLDSLLEQANILKLGKMNEQNSFEVYKKMNEYNDLKKKIISEFGSVNQQWTEKYNEYENHPIKMRPFPEIYDLTELDENNYQYFYKEYEKLNNLFLQAYCDVRRFENKSFRSLGEDEEDSNIDQIAEDDEKKLKGMITDYYSMNSVLEYNKQEEKITRELAKINQKWLEAKSEKQLVRYEGDTNIKTSTFRNPHIYTLFEKLIRFDKEIRQMNKERADSYRIERKQFEWEETKREILKMQ